MRKRYIFVCPVCDRLTDALRNDALTCSTACRVRLHRNPSLLDADRKIYQQLRVPLSMELQARALQELCPELQKPILEAKLTVKDAQPAVCRAFDKLVAKTARRVRQTRRAETTKTDQPLERLTNNET
jgi:hypothetical protein